MTSATADGASALPEPAELARRVVAAATATGRTIAVAESLTGGMVAALVVDVAGASAVLRGGIVAYATEVKSTVLGVDADLLSERGPVDPDVALEMAEGVRRLLDADVGVATTGVAGPEPQDGTPVGVAHVAATGDAGARVRSLDLDGDRATIRGLVARHALDLLAAHLLEPAGDGSASHVS